MTRMTSTAIDTGPLHRAPAMLREALDFWHEQADGTPLSLSLEERRLVREIVGSGLEFNGKNGVRSSV